MSLTRTLPSFATMRLARTYRERYLCSFLMSTALHVAVLAGFFCFKDERFHPAEYGIETRPRTLSVAWIDADAEQSSAAPEVAAEPRPAESKPQPEPVPQQPEPSPEPVAQTTEPIQAEPQAAPAQSVAPESPPSAPTPKAIASALTETTAQPPPQPSVAANSPSGSAVAEAKPDHLRNPTPPYPRLARERGWQGTTTLHIEVLANGIPGQIRILKSSGHRVLDEVSVETVRQQWKFLPARRGDTPIDSWVEQAISFQMRG